MMTESRRPLAFLLMPVERRDVQALFRQWQGVSRTLARSICAAGLIADHHPVLAGGGGLTGVLVAASRGWLDKWRPALAAGWRSGAADGILTGIAGVLDAVWLGHRTIVRDAAVVAIGWSLWISLWLVLAALVLGAGVACAQVAESSDVARGLLGQLLPFLGASSVLGQGLGTMAGVLGTIAFTIAGLAAVWSSVLMLVEYTTAPETARNHYNPAMFSIRVAVALGLLCPLSGGWGAGMQLVGWVGVAGSNYASKAWSAMTGFFADSQQWVANPGVSPVDALLAVAGTLTAEACMAAINQDPGRNANERVVGVTDQNQYRYDYQANHWYGWTTEAAGGCGTVTYRTTSSDQVGDAAAAAMDGVQQAAFEQMRGIVHDAVTGFLQQRISCRDAPATCGPDPDATPLAQEPTVYRQQISDLVAQGWASINGTIGATLAANTTTGGWIGAGQVAQTLSKLQGSLAAAAGAVPQVSPPTLESVQDAVEAVQQWAGNGLIAVQNPVVDAAMAAASGSSGALDKALRAATATVWQTIAEVPQMNPLGGLSTLGQTIYLSGIGLYVLAGMAGPDSGGGTGGSLVSRTIGNAVGTVTDLAIRKLPGPTRVVGLFVDLAAWAGDKIRPIIQAGAFAIIVVGIALAYLVPALPFIRFYFAVIGWLIAFVESVFLVDLLLVLMVSPESGGLLASAAKAGCWNILGLFLRPILTLIGFVAGLMAISVAIGLLNTMMLPMMRDATGGDVMFVSFLAYLLIYFGIAYVTVNVCTKVAESLPAAGYRWLGANAAADRDEGSAVPGAIGGATSRVMQEISTRLRIRR